MFERLHKSRFISWQKLLTIFFFLGFIFYLFPRSDCETVIITHGETQQQYSSQERENDRRKDDPRAKPQRKSHTNSPHYFPEAPLEQKEIEEKPIARMNNQIKEDISIYDGAIPETSKLSLIERIKATGRYNNVFNLKWQNIRILFFLILEYYSAMLLFSFSPHISRTR